MKCMSGLMETASFLWQKKYFFLPLAGLLAYAAGAKHGYIARNNEVEYLKDQVRYTEMMRLDEWQVGFDMGKQFSEPTGAIFGFNKDKSLYDVYVITKDGGKVLLPKSEVSVFQKPEETIERKLDDDTDI